MKGLTVVANRIDSLEEKAYIGSDLGLTYAPESSTFKLWAPDADEVMIYLYETGDVKHQAIYQKHSMKLEGNLWIAELKGDLSGLFYTYVIHRGDEMVEVVDIYAKAVGIDGNRAAIINLNQTNPVDWSNDRFVGKKLNESYIWEVHVEDFSSAKSSGVREEYRGKYLAFTEKNTTLYGAGEIATGLDYLQQLGISHVHLLPAFDYDNNEQEKEYNWGYNPKNYNVPEGKYSSDPLDPTVRIREFKQMVQSLHQAGVGVVLDVVYNHTSLTENSWFNLTVPDYYYRQDAQGGFADGSACGNEVASERKMMRQYMIDSILHWAQEYHLDGFRFDLMGLHDVETMNQIRKALDQVGLQHVLMYGEPWDAGNNQIKKPNLSANKANATAFRKGIAVFNDNLRDSVKGDVFIENDGAFVQGMNGKYQKKQTVYNKELQAGILGNSLPVPDVSGDIIWSANPSQVVAYVSAHDNLTLWDKLVATSIEAPQDSDYARNEDLVQMNRLAATLLFTSQGGLFTHAGEEYGRTKLGDENSYVSSLAINQINWEQVAEFADLVDFYRGLNQIRQQFRPLTSGTIEAARSYQFYSETPENILAYQITDDSKTSQWRELLVLVNGSDESHEISLQPKDTIWHILADNESASVESKGTLKVKSVHLAAKSLLILAR